MMKTRHGSLLTPVLLATLLVAAGCGGDTNDPGAEPGAEEPASPTDDDAGNAAGGTTMQVHSVSEATSAEVEGNLHVVGLLIDDGSGWRLCESVLESHPPQCGGESLTVEGVDASELPLEESGGVRWQTEATVVGEVEGDTLTVTGSAASS